MHLNVEIVDMYMRILIEGEAECEKVRGIKSEIRLINGIGNI